MRYRVSVVWCDTEVELTGKYTPERFAVIRNNPEDCEPPESADFETYLATIGGLDVRELLLSAYIKDAVGYKSVMTILEIQAAEMISRNFTPGRVV